MGWEGKGVFACLLGAEKKLEPLLCNIYHIKIVFQNPRKGPQNLRQAERLSSEGVSHSHARSLTLKTACRSRGGSLLNVIKDKPTS